MRPSKRGTGMECDELQPHPELMPVKRPKDINVVFKPWAEWHALVEGTKEAKRLLRMTLEADRKGESIDRRQIEGFLDGTDR